jgi:anti-sigma B factor antagonist
MELVEISVCAESDFYQIELTGELDACSSIVLDQALEKATMYKPPHIYIDCQNLTYISSAGLGAIISHLHTCHINNTGIALLNVQPAVQDICESIGLNKFIQIKGQSAEIAALPEIP